MHQVHAIESIFGLPHEVFFYVWQFTHMKLLSERVQATSQRPRVLFFYYFFNLPLRSFIASVWGFIKELSR